MNNKLKVIDLLNKIATKEIDYGFAFKYDNKIFFVASDNQIVCKDTGVCLFNSDVVEFILNDEVEIVEENKPIEKIKVQYQDNHNQEEINEYLRCSINELIDKINSIGYERDR